MTIRGSTIFRRSSPSRRMPVPITAAARPMTIAHRNSLPFGREKDGIGEIARENVPSPVHESSPTKMSDPTPAASNPGTRMTLSRPPPRPATSIRRNAPTIGDPSNVLMAAKLPATPMTTVAIAGASRLNRRTAIAPSPPPIAISGASGPSTAPRHRVASAATRMPGKSSAGAGPPVILMPSAGECPPSSGHIADRERDECATEKERQDRPPGRWAVKTDVHGHGGEEELLSLGDCGEEEIGEGGDRNADDGAREESYEVNPVPQ